MCNQKLSNSLTMLARYAPIFEIEGFCWGHWHKPDDPQVLPYFIDSKEASAFSVDAFGYGWVLEGFDWSIWIGGKEAERLLTKSGAIEKATAEQLFKLLTSFVRGDRFGEGCLAEAYESGVLTRIVRRAAALTSVLTDLSCGAGTMKP